MKSLNDEDSMDCTNEEHSVENEVVKDIYVHLNHHSPLKALIMIIIKNYF